MIRAARIVAAIGPASSEPEVLLKMINVDCDIIRLNFSHGTAQTMALYRNVTPVNLATNLDRDATQA
jgi:pyruvate kinase